MKSSSCSFSVIEQYANSAIDERERERERERDRNYGCKMEKVSLFPSDSYRVSKNSHTMWLLFSETSTRR